jgi:hypothetical protein
MISSSRVDKERDIVAEKPPYIIKSYAGVLDDVVQERGADRSGI